MPSNDPRNIEYLLQGIGWSRTSDEFDRLERFARAHYTGRLLEQVQAAIASRRRAVRGHDSSPTGGEAVDGFDYDTRTG